MGQVWGRVMASSMPVTRAEPSTVVLRVRVRAENSHSAATAEAMHTRVRIRASRPKRTTPTASAGVRASITSAMMRFVRKLPRI